MRPTWRLGDEELRAWLDRLLEEGRQVIAPVVQNGITLLRPVTDAGIVSLDPGKTRWSPKEFLFPRTETLYSFRLSTKGPQLVDPPLAQTEQVLFGLRSCDAAGLVRLDEVFLHGTVEDPLYARRRALTTVVALACAHADAECFCTAVGGSPMGTEGVDLLGLPCGDRWLFRALTEKGEALAPAGRARASEADWSFAEEQVQRVAETMQRARLPDNVAALLERRFDSQVWGEVARRCLGCSICAYACPSCSCFDVHHEGNPWGGRELRCWDACTYALFTRHASGHNPRKGADARYRQRTLHKFAYLAPDGDDVIRCVGCGRCTALCPVGLDIHHAVGQALAASDVHEGERTTDGKP